MTKKRFPHSCPANTSQERKKQSKGTTKLKNVSSTTADEMPSLYKYTSWGDDDNELNAAGQTNDQCSNHLLTNESPFITLEDGCIISKTQQRDCFKMVNSYETITEAKVGNLSSLSLQSVLQSQLLKHTHPKEDTPLCNRTGIDIEAKMESLCLIIIDISLYVRGDVTLLIRDNARSHGAPI